jgi:hypothetical protein
MDGKKRLTFLATIGFVCLAFHPLREYGVDPLLFEVNDVSGYQISHFVMYFLIGYVEFLNINEVVGFSVLWELMEYTIGRVTNEVDHWTSGGVHGQFTDVSLNIAGYLWGSVLRNVAPCSMTNCQAKLVQGYSSMAVLILLVAYASTNKL